MKTRAELHAAVKAAPGNTLAAALWAHILEQEDEIEELRDELTIATKEADAAKRSKRKS